MLPSSPSLFLPLHPMPIFLPPSSFPPFRQHALNLLSLCFFFILPTQTSSLLSPFSSSLYHSFLTPTSTAFIARLYLSTSLHPSLRLPYVTFMFLSLSHDRNHDNHTLLPLTVHTPSTSFSPHQYQNLCHSSHSISLPSSENKALLHFKSKHSQQTSCGY